MSQLLKVGLFFLATVKKVTRMSLTALQEEGAVIDIEELKKAPAELRCRASRAASRQRQAGKRQPPGLICSGSTRARRQPLARRQRSSHHAHFPDVAEEAVGPGAVP